MKNKNLLIELLDKHGKILCTYAPKTKKYWVGVYDSQSKEDVETLKTKDFMEVGYYFLIDDMSGEPLALTSIGDQWGKLGFNDRISRIDRKATKPNTLIYNNHVFSVVFVPPSKIKYFLDNESVWNFLKGTKKTERNTILENARLLKKVYSFKY